MFVDELHYFKLIKKEQSHQFLVHALANFGFLEDVGIGQNVSIRLYAWSTIIEM